MVSRWPRGRQRHLAPPQHRDLPSNADVPQTIRPVARHFQIDRKIAADLLGRLMVGPVIISRRSSSADGISSGTYCFSQIPGD